MKRSIAIFDTTLRDGEQAPGCSMGVDDKIQVAEQLELLGADVVEAGFPAASMGDFDAVTAISKKAGNICVAALCRARPRDINIAAKALKYACKARIHTFIATSDIHMRYKLNMTRNEVIDAVRKNVRLAKSLAPQVEFSAEDASRTERSFLLDVVECALDAGATIINLPDTVGYTMPHEYGEMFRSVRWRFPDESITLSAHAHDDLGLAVANSLAAVQNGAGQVECTINGIGERAGNASLEEVVMALKTRTYLFNADTDINTEMLYPLSRLVSSVIHVPVPPNKAVVGDNAFAHEAGIHQDGILKNPLTYEIMTPQSVGVDMRKLVIGKHSGRHALYEQCRRIGVELTADEMNVLYTTVINMADEQGEIKLEDLQCIIEKNFSHAVETI